MPPSPFFIVGHERSGTTLAAAMFDRHSRVAVPPETHFFTDLCPPNRAHETADPIFMVNHLSRGCRMRDLGLNGPELLDRLARVRPTWANLFLQALKLYAEPRGKELTGEKTPNHWRHVPELLELFPNSRLIWVVRDGRDTVLSLMKAPWKRHSNVVLHALSWRRCAERMLALESRFSDRILRLRFEDLVTTPQAEIGRACEFIGVDFESRQLDPAAETGVVPAWELPWKGRVLAPPDPSRIGVASREMTEESMEILNLVMGPSLNSLGYESDRPASLAAPQVA